MQNGLGKTLVAAEHQTNLLLTRGKGAAVAFARLRPRCLGRHQLGGCDAGARPDMRVIAPDIAGFGYTEFKDGNKYDIKLWVRHLVGILDALGLGKASFCGNFGGALAIGLAAFAPERVDKLVLLGTPAGEFVQTAGLRSVEYEPDGEHGAHAEPVPL